MATPPTFNLFIPGTWETSEYAESTQATGMLKPAAQTVAATHTNATVHFLPYMARAFDNGQTYAESKATAIESAEAVLSDFATRHPDARFTITGFSQGADAAGDLAAKIGNGNGPVPADKVIAVGLLSDPRSGTAGVTTVGPQGSGVGIADPRPEGMGALAGKVSTICSPQDLYCAIDKRSHPLLGVIGTALGKDAAAAQDAVDDAINVVSTLASIDFPRIQANATSLQTAVESGNLALAQDAARSLNELLEPMVALASIVDYQQVAQVLALIPDQTGVLKAAAALCEVLARTDIRLAADVFGQVQEIGWQVADTAGADGMSALDAARKVVSGVDILELGKDAASIFSLTPRAGEAVELVSQDMWKRGGELVTVLSTTAITRPASIIHDALRAEQFLTSNAHSAYGSFVVDAHGTTAVQWLGDWLATSISEAANTYAPTTSDPTVKAAP